MHVLLRLTPADSSPDSQPRSPHYGEGQYTAPAVLFAFLIGLQCCISTLRLVYGGLLILRRSNALEAGVSKIHPRAMQGMPRV
ncbi:hypothetical protein BV22DRAFT_938249 [Leucogyrophana mollusca]|uniref:Uncharacterized protein n=1 Tax=Leucogyrophana mollusca TaxID=85980 RepID=A0ACB8AVT9_9AGAM|nr:hypothetical protein BV22DRAFT_938249 [Leucogyrophana mollusca]